MDCKIFDRKNCSYENKSEQFCYNGDVNYERQYFSIYRSRLDYFRPNLTSLAAEKFGDDFPVKKLTDLQENEKCLIIGTIYKQQELKPSILKQIAGETNTLPQPVGGKFTEKTDKLILEDENLRVSLTGNIFPGEFVTGVVLGLYGCETEGGTFQVDQIIYPSLKPPKPLPKMEEDVYVLLISGLFFGGKSSDDVRQWMNVATFVDWLTGCSGGDEEQIKVSKICRVIIAGNSISDKLNDKNFANLAKYITRKTASPSVEAVRNLDNFLEKISASIDVDLMPGEFDPVNHFMPQQPLHKCTLPKAGRFSTMHNVTNPYMAEIEGLTFLGTSGQNVDDIYRFCDVDDRLDITKQTLSWAHLLPTSPDTLDCYPYYKRDPFVIAKRPHVYFVGNQPEFACDLVKYEDEKTLLVTLPHFASSGCFALVNLKNLMVEPVTFNCPSLNSSDE